MADKIELLPIPHIDLPELTALEDARHMIEQGHVMTMTKPDGTRVRIPDPWERGEP